MIKIKGLEVSFADKTILPNFELTINKGESLAIIGESGAGKTTLAKAMIGFKDGINKGEILYKGQDLLKQTEKNLREIRWQEISLVFQNVEDCFNPRMTILQQIEETIKNQNKAEKVKRSHQYLKETGLEESKHDNYPHQLSGGEKQRALIAMAMINKPEVIILDEPTSGLDQLTKKSITKLLQQERNKSTLVTITHDLQLVRELSERLVVMYGGRIVEIGVTKEILQNPKHPYTRGLIRSFPSMDSVKDLQSIAGQSGGSSSGCVFNQRCTQSIEICRQHVPVLKGEGHQIACHRGGIIPFLRCKSITKRYGSLTVLDGIDLTIYEGETLAVVGQSGSGKTTLARIIIGLIQKTAGSLYIEDVEVNVGIKELYQRVQLIPQNPRESTSHRLSIMDIVMEPLVIQVIGNKEERIKKVKEVLLEVDLPVEDYFLNTYMHHLSGGEAQRVAIARALITRPRLLIADEPTSALDPSIQAKILKLLLNLQEKRGLAILLITHDLAIARKVSDRLLVLKEGKVVETGSTISVLSSPKEIYTKELLGKTKYCFDITDEIML